MKIVVTYISELVDNEYELNLSAWKKKWIFKKGKYSRFQNKEYRWQCLNSPILPVEYLHWWYLWSQIPQLATGVISPPSIHTGNCYLTRMFSRLVKETLDLMKTLKEETDAQQQQSVTNETILPTLLVGQEECQSIQSSMMSILEKSWAWLAGVLDVVEGQLRMGKHFDTKVGLSLLLFKSKCRERSISWERTCTFNTP